MSEVPLYSTPEMKRQYAMTPLSVRGTAYTTLERQPCQPEGNASPLALERQPTVSQRDSVHHPCTPAVASLEATHGQILSQYPTDATSSRWHLHGS